MRLDILYSVVDELKVGDMQKYIDDEVKPCLPAGRNEEGKMKNLAYQQADEELKTVSKMDSDRYSKIENWMEKYQVQAFFRDQKGYHHKLYSVSSSPFIIYAMGDLSVLDQDILGIVGPRNNTEYAHEIMKKLFDEARKYQIATISGLAPGVDTLCHRLSIKNKIPTIAVLGGGLRNYMRSSRRALIEEIIKNGGLVLSEFKLDFVPTRYSFPQRNRLIAGLCDNLFLPEAGLRSGSLITANCALKKGKPIYIAPNNIFCSNSKGSNSLLQDKNVNIIVDFENFFANNYEARNNKQIKEAVENIELSEDERKIVKYLNISGEMDLSNLSSKTGLLIGSLMESLTLLEMNKIVCQREPGSYSCMI